MKELLKIVYTKREFIHLMEKIEAEYPEILWYEGQKPTRWLPQKFPRKIYLDEERKLIAPRL